MTAPGKGNGTFALRRDRSSLRNHRTKVSPARVFIAADDSVTIQHLGSSIENWGYESVVVFNDREIVRRMEREALAPLVILDGAMGETDTLALCRRIRLSSQTTRPYIILLTETGGDRKALFDPSWGPDELLIRPFTRKELHVRINTGMRIMDLERNLTKLAADLKRAATRIEKLSGLLPICSYCKKIRDDSGYWNELEKYISDHSDAEFSHAICPSCLSKYYPDAKDECL